MCTSADILKSIRNKYTGKKKEVLQNMGEKKNSGKLMNPGNSIVRLLHFMPLLTRQIRLYTKRVVI